MSLLLLLFLPHRCPQMQLRTQKQLLGRKTQWLSIMGFALPWEIENKMHEVHSPASEQSVLLVGKLSSTAECLSWALLTL